MMKIGVFGGTFNPVHKGHEMTAKSFYKKFHIDRLLIIPTFITPQKKIDTTVLPIQRFEMCKLAFDVKKYNGYNIEVSDIEIKKEGRSYSFETVKALHEIYGSEKYKESEENTIYFLIGTDMFLSIESWYRYKELLNMCVLVVAYRHESEIDLSDERSGDIFAKKNQLVESGFRVEFLENSAFEISSTELRKKIKNSDTQGDELTQWLNADVIEYIKKEKLYRDL